MSVILRNQEYIPHQAVIFTSHKYLDDFSLRKVNIAYEMRKNCLGGDSAIWEIEFHLTNQCNLHCAGCSYGTRHNQKSLSLKRMLAILEQYTPHDLRSVFFSGGGDPLLWEYWSSFFATVEKACSYGIATNMFNFASIENFWKFFDFYQIHVTGYNAKTSKATTGIDSFQQIDDNISFLLKNRLSSQNIALKILINNENYKDLSQYLDYVLEKDADSIILKYQQDFLVNRDLSADEILNAIRTIAYSHPIVHKYNYLLDNLDDTIFYTYPYPDVCLFANSGLYRLVNADGELFPCIAANANRENKIKNEKEFIDIYSKEMRDGKCPLKACRHYRFSQYLSHTVNLDASNNMMPPIPVLL